MPSLNDILEVAELLKSKPVVCAEERCVAVRNRNASCRKCAEACVTQCIEIDRNRLIIDEQACVNCGVCASVCPTDALTVTNPLDEAIVVEAVQAWQERCTHDTGVEVPAAIIACARAAAQKTADSRLHATVPCLGRIDEVLLLGPLCAPNGPTDMLLVDGDCATCRYGSVSPTIDEACEGTRTLIDAFDIPATVARTSVFPADVLLVDDHQRTSLHGRERRSLVSDAKRFATSAAKATAEKAIADALNQTAGTPTLRDRLKVNPQGALPTFPAERNLVILDALTEVAPDLDALPPTTLDTRLFGSVTIDTATCSGCGMCAMFCPTGALRFSDVVDHPAEDMRYLEFQAADCVQCNLCADVCLHHSVTVSPQVSLHDLLDFEPELLEVPQPQRTVDIFRQKYRTQKQGESHGA